MVVDYRGWRTPFFSALGLLLQFKLLWSERFGYHIYWENLQFKNLFS